MSQLIHVNKIDAAQRQLNVGIRLLFGDADPIAVHTIIGAASTIFSDLIEQIIPKKSWDKLAQQANNLCPSEYFQIMRKAQNFLKHAKDDHEAVLEFDSEDTEALAFWAVMNCSELTPMSKEAQIFQLWYIASHSPLPDQNQSPLKEAIELFGDLRHSSREARLQIGTKVLAQLTQE